MFLASLSEFPLGAENLLIDLSSRFSILVSQANRLFVAAATPDLRFCVCEDRNTLYH
jgi:hypothetical protein